MGASITWTRSTVRSSRIAETTVPTTSSWHDPSQSHGKGRALLPNGSHGVAAAERPSPHGRNAH
jgi:hypothetical protein